MYTDHGRDRYLSYAVSMPCCKQGLLIEPNLQEFEKIPAKRPNAIAVNAAICSQEQLVHFVGKGAIIPLTGNSAGMQRSVFKCVPLRVSKQQKDTCLALDIIKVLRFLLLAYMEFSSHVTRQSVLVSCCQLHSKPFQFCGL